MAIDYVDYVDPDTGVSERKIESAREFGKKAIAEAAKHVILHPEAFRSMPFQTPEICMAATEQNFEAFEHVIDQTQAVCILAMERDERVYSYIRDGKIRDAVREIHPPFTGRIPAKKNPDEFSMKFVAEAVKRLTLDPKLIFYLPFETPETRMAAVMQDGSLICIMDEKAQTPSLRAAAVHQTWEGLEGVAAQSPEIIGLALETDIRAVAGIRNQETRERFIFHFFDEKGLTVPEEIEKPVLEVLNREARKAAAPGGPHA